jgi:hypothetical protein
MMRGLFLLLFGIAIVNVSLAQVTELQPNNKNQTQRFLGEGSKKKKPRSIVLLQKKDTTSRWLNFSMFGQIYQWSNGVPSFAQGVAGNLMAAPFTSASSFQSTPSLAFPINFRPVSSQKKKE